MKRSLLTATLAIFITGCATSRVNVDDYELVRSGQISQANVADFKACIGNAFADRTIGLGVVLLNREQVRGNTYRVELVSSETGAVLSADINNDGTYALYQVKLGVADRMRGEREKFDACTARY